MELFLVGHDGAVSMPVRYDQDIKVKAIRLMREDAGYPSEYAAITAAARRQGMTPGDAAHVDQPEVPRSCQATTSTRPVT